MPESAGELSLWTRKGTEKGAARLLHDKDNMPSAG